MREKISEMIRAGKTSLGKIMCLSHQAAMNGKIS